MLGLWVAAVVWFRWGAWAPDLSALLIAAWLWEHGQGDLIYAMPPGFFGGAASDWAEAMATMGIAGQQTYPYLYPPLWVALLAPLTSIWSPQALMNAALMVQVPLLAGAVVLAGRLAKPLAMSWTVWALWGMTVLSFSSPAYLALLHLQPSIFMGFVILWAFACLAAGKPTGFGALIALAAAIKLSPALFILAAVMTRSGRALWVFAVVGAGLGLLSIWLAGWPAHDAMLTSVRAATSHTLMISTNISLESVLTQLWLSPDTLPASIPTRGTATVLGGVLAVSTAALLVRRAPTWPLALRPLAALLGLSLTIWLLGPLGWLHYYVMPLLLLPGLARLMPIRWAMTVGGAAVLMSLMPVYLVLAGHPGFHALYPALASAAWLAVLLSVLWGRKTPPKP